MNRVLFVLLAALIGSGAEAQVFKCVDSHGAVTFTDVRCGAGQAESTAKRARTAQEKERDEVEAAHQDSLKVLRAAQAASESTQAEPAVQYQASAPKSYEQRLAERNAGVESTQKSGDVYPKRTRSDPDNSAPSTITRCSGAYCYDDRGSAYFRFGKDMFTGPNGSTCNKVGAVLYCR